MAHRLTIALPDDVYEAIKEQAERDMRTIGAEIAYQLRLHVPAYKPEETQINKINRKDII